MFKVINCFIKKRKNQNILGFIFIISLFILIQQSKLIWILEHRYSKLTNSFSCSASSFHIENTLPLFQIYGYNNLVILRPLLAKFLHILSFFYKQIFFITNFRIHKDAWNFKMHKILVHIRYPGQYLNIKWVLLYTVLHRKEMKIV